MKVIYHDCVKKGIEIYPLLEKATAQLQEVLGRSADWVTAEWDCRDDKRLGKLYSLHLRDHFNGAATGEFSPDEFARTAHLRNRLHDLWGDLLQDRSHKQLAKVLETTAAPEN